MHYLSKPVAMSFEDAVAATKQALKRGHFAILAEIDLGMALRRHLAVDFQPYLILSACNPPLAQRAIQADEQIGSILLCNILVQQHRDGHVEISAADPADTIGTINHVDLVWTARELRSLVQRAIDDIESVAKPRRVLRGREKAARQPAHAAA